MAVGRGIGAAGILGLFLWCALGCAGLLPWSTPCLSRAVCADEGQCGTSRQVSGEGAYRCYVRGEADCAASAACTEGGRCAYDPRVSLACVRPSKRPLPGVSSVCEGSAECVRWGRCAVVEGACLAATADRCAESLDCVVGGRCSLVGRHCMARSDADCEGSLECAVYGRCTHDVHPIMGAGAGCVAGPGAPTVGSCNYTGSGAARCAQTGECLKPGSGQECEKLSDHGRESERLDRVRARLRGAHDVPKPPRLR